MAVLVTGGFGHVGSWIGVELARRGKHAALMDVHCPDLKHLRPHRENITGICANLLEFPALVQAIVDRAEGVEGIIHAASVSAAAAFRQQPYTNTHLNLIGTLNVLEVARVLKIPRVVYVSSGAVYGLAKGPLIEEQTPERPADLYGATKLSSELISLQYAKWFGLDVRIVRLYFVYGPGVKPSAHHPLYKTLFGPLEGLTDLKLERGRDQKVDWTYVSDAAEGTILALEVENPTHRIFNISSGKAYSIDDVLAAVRRYALVAAKVEVGPGLLVERGSPMDISRAEKVLGFKPRFGLEEGIKAYAEWLLAEHDKSRLPNI